MHLKTPSTFPTKRFLELFYLIQCTFPGEEVLRAEGRRALSNLVVDAGVATVVKCSIEEDIARDTSTSRLLRHYLKKDGARVWIVGRERCSSSEFGKLQHCLTWTAHTAKRSGYRVLGVDFC